MTDPRKSSCSLKRAHTCMVCIDMFTFIMFTTACIRDLITEAGDFTNSCIDRRCKTRVGCVLRESQTTSHASSLIVKPYQRSKSTRPLFSWRAPAITRSSWLPTSRFLEVRVDKLFRRLFPRNPLGEQNCQHNKNQVWSDPDCATGPLRVLHLQRQRFGILSARSRDLASKHADVIFLQGY
jgi:hypothetical protein